MRFFLLFEKMRAKKSGVKISSIKNLNKLSHLICESPVSLSNTKIVSDLPIYIGRHTYIRSGSEIHNVSRIGRYCSFGSGVVLGLDRGAHPIEWATTSPYIYKDFSSSPKMVDIGHDVWIGQGAVVLSGVSIGNGAVIGVNSVVTKDVEPYQIVAGNPAKPIRYRFDEDIIAKLQNSKWWDYPIEDLKKCNYQDAEKYISDVKNLNKQAEKEVIKIVNRKVLS